MSGEHVEEAYEAATGGGRRPRWRQVAAIGLMVPAVAAATWLGLDRIAKNAETTDALCALRLDLQKRVAIQEGFLRDNPEGVPGIPAKTIQTGIDNQKRTVKALSTLSC